jgi:hypothetical protein
MTGVQFRAGQDFSLPLIMIIIMNIMIENILTGIGLQSRSQWP